MKRLVLGLFLAAAGASTLLGIVTQVRKNVDFEEMAAAHSEPGAPLRVWSGRIAARWGDAPVRYVREPRAGENAEQAGFIAQFGLAPVLVSESAERVLLDFSTAAAARGYAAARGLRIVEEEGGRAMAVPSA